MRGIWLLGVPVSDPVVVLNCRPFYPPPPLPENIGPCFETLLMSQLGGGTAAGQDAAEHPTMHRTTPHNKEVSGPKMCQ